MLFKKQYVALYYNKVGSSTIDLYHNGCTASFKGVISFVYQLKLKRASSKLETNTIVSNSGGGYELVVGFHDATGELNLIIKDIDQIALVLGCDPNILERVQRQFTLYGGTFGLDIYVYNRPNNNTSDNNVLKLAKHCQFCDKEKIWHVLALPLAPPKSLESGNDQNIVVRTIGMDGLKMYTNAYKKHTLRVMKIESLSVKSEIIKLITSYTHSSSS